MKMQKISLLPHNEKAVNDIIDAYESGKKNVCYVSGVGCGKSYVFMKLAEEYFKDKRILYVIPKYAIEQNIHAYDEYTLIGDKIDVVTYNYFSNLQKGIRKINNYDYVILDEVHHIGSTIYGAILRECMGLSGTHFLGLTATPVREDGIDVTECFDVTVEGLSTFNAIKNKLMPPFTYRICLPENITNIENGIKGKYNKFKIGIDYEMSEDMLRQVLLQYPRKKWVIFCRTVESINKHLPLIMRLFPDYNIYPLYSELNNLKQVMDGVQKSEKAIVVSCNMFLEGVHINDVDGIILFRNVVSLSTFQQMLGRVCKIGKNTSPVVIDCTSCGPKLLTTLMDSDEVYQESGISIAQKIDIIEDNLKELMNIGLNEHKEWEDIDKFLQCVVHNQEKKIINPEHVREAAKEYFRMLGSTKNTSKLIKSCADLWDIPSNALIDYICKQNEMER